MRNFIIKEINRLVEKHGTNDPFEIAQNENIIIIFEPLGLIKGYYNSYVRQKFIHINSDLDEIERHFTCAHELGHAILHPSSNTPFLRSYTYFSVDKIESQANKFATELILYNLKVDKHSLDTIDLNQISKQYMVPLELVKYKFS